MKNYRFVGKPQKRLFSSRELMFSTSVGFMRGSCATVTNPQNGKSYVFSKYISGGVEFVAGKDASVTGCSLLRYKTVKFFERIIYIGSKC